MKNKAFDLIEHRKNESANLSGKDNYHLVLHVFLRRLRHPITPH